MKSYLLLCFCFVWLAGCASQEALSSKDDGKPLSFAASTNALLTGDFNEPSKRQVVMGGRRVKAEPATAQFAKVQPMESNVQSAGVGDMLGGMLGGGSGEQQIQAAPRLVIHQGSINLRSANPRKVLDTATQMAIDLGGSVESRNSNDLVLRIPASLFRAHFDDFTHLATLLNKSIQVDDVTEQFQENDLRIRVAKETLEHLQTLLAESKDAFEKINLLQDIQRLSSQIDLQEAEQKDLSHRVQYSRLALNVKPFIFQPSGKEPIAAFRWIQLLKPQRVDEKLEGDAFVLPVPQGMVDLGVAPGFFHHKGVWAAAASDGSEIWARTIHNEPNGDAIFWQQVLHLRLGQSFAKSSVDSVGAWRFVSLESFGDSPYEWIVAVSVVDCKLHVVEMFFPSRDAKQKHWAQVTSMLQGVQP